jgi:Tfp pilus assembly ATPase PilU
MRNADSQNELRLRIKLESRREASGSKDGEASLTLQSEEREMTF